jgi:hypothetical protein
MQNLQIQGNLRSDRSLADLVVAGVVVVAQGTHRFRRMLVAEGCLLTRVAWDGSRGVPAASSSSCWQRA